MTIAVQPKDYQIEVKNVTLAVPSVNGVYDTDYLAEYYEKKNVPGNAQITVASQSEYTTYIYLSWYEITVNQIENIAEEGKDWILSA